MHALTPPPCVLLQGLHSVSQMLTGGEIKLRVPEFPEEQETERFL